MPRKKIFIRLLCIIIAIIVLISGIFLWRREVKNWNGNWHGNESATAGQFANLVQSGVLYPVERVIDGDTLVATVADHEVTVRLIGMDTPEVVDPRKPVQCFGPEASAEAKEILTGKEVYIEKDPTKGDYDKYGRVLAYIYLSDADKTLFNLTMIEQGFAREYTYFDQPYKYQAQFKQAETQAKASLLGLWNPKTCPVST